MAIVMEVEREKERMVVGRGGFAGEDGSGSGFVGGGMSGGRQMLGMKKREKRDLK